MMERIAHKGTFDKLKFSRDLDHKVFNESSIPEFLADQDYYFKNFDPCIDMEAIYGESDSERIIPLPTEQDFDDKLTEWTEKKLSNLLTYMEAMNATMVKLRLGLEKEFTNSISFWLDIVKQGQKPQAIPDVECPPRENL